MMAEQAGDGRPGGSPTLTHGGCPSAPAGTQAVGCYQGWQFPSATSPGPRVSAHLCPGE